MTFPTFLRLLPTSHRLFPTFLGLFPSFFGLFPTILSLFLTFPLFSQQITGLKNLIEPGAVLTKVSSQFIFTEGPAADKKGNVFFTDQPNNKIWKYDTKSKLSIFMEDAGRSNGLYFDNDGCLIACADEKNEMWRINMKGKKEVILKGEEGKSFNGPNDVWVAPNGNFYFTDPYYHRPYWNKAEIAPKEQNVYLLLNGKGPAILCDNTLSQPNGIVGTSDGKYLFVADIAGDRTYKYEIGKDGLLINRQVFAQHGSDGMTIDSLGNLYITGNGVTVFNPQGKRIGHIDVPSGWTANICFAGKDKKTLFITASESIYTLRMEVAGM